MESVQFNNSEELVLAGSHSGTLKIWDLEAAKSRFLPMEFVLLELEKSMQYGEEDYVCILRITRTLSTLNVTFSNTHW